MIRIRIKITGKVQGVFFRVKSVEKAQELGHLTGFVANEADGSVTVVAEGPENKVNALVDWCHSGPSRAEVEKVEVERQDYSGEFEGFEVRY